VDGVPKDAVIARKGYFPGRAGLSRINPIRGELDVRVSSFRRKAASRWRMAASELFSFSSPAIILSQKAFSSRGFSGAAGRSTRTGAAFWLGRAFRRLARGGGCASPSGEGESPALQLFNLADQVQEGRDLPEMAQPDEQRFEVDLRLGGIPEPRLRPPEGHGGSAAAPPPSPGWPLPEGGQSSALRA